MNANRVTLGRISIALAACTLISLGACSRDADLVGTFGGDWNIGGTVMTALPDGGTANHANADAKKGVSSESEVTVSRKASGEYGVTIDTPFMSCMLSAKINDAKELVFDGPSTQSDLYAPDSLKRWPHCTFSFEGFRGEANVRGTLRSKGGGAISITMQVIPCSSESVRVMEGSAASASFAGSRERRVKR